MTDEIARVAFQRRLERVCAFRQLQGVANQIAQLTDGRLLLDDFTVPDTVKLWPVRDGEVRVVREIGGKNVAFV